jgi:ATP-dependent DNA helicase RecG
VSRALALIRQLNELDEHPSLEAKACNHGAVGDSFFETVCAFSNEPDLGGGTLLLGVTQREQDFFGGYEARGVAQLDKLQADIASGCATLFNSPIRPRTSVELLDGRSVVIVEIDELPSGQKPLYFKRHGLPRGAWRRIGSTDQRCTEEDLVVFYGNRDTESYDLTLLTHASLADLDPEAIAHYRKLRTKVNPAAEELSWTDTELLQALSAIRLSGDEWRPTMTGLLLFGTRMAMRRELPAVRVDYVRVTGKTWVSDPEKRFSTTVDMRGPLLQLVERAQAAVMDDLPKGFELPEGHVQADTPTLPARVLREAIVNALMHRSYRHHQPTQIIRYSNRIEIRNVGFSLKNEESLGEPGSALRNPHLAAVFHETNTAETKGSGIRVMREQMRQHGFSPPTFESSRDDNYFVSRLLLHHFLSAEDLAWLGAIPHELSESQRYALIFLREQGAVDNRTLRQLTGAEVLEASQDLRRLRDLKLLVQQGKGSATYYLPGPSFPGSRPVGVGHTGLSGSHTGLAPEHTGLASEHTGLAPEHTGLSLNLPAELLLAVSALGARPPEPELRVIIQRLCAWQPLSATQLAALLGRKDPDALKRTHLRPMVDCGALSLLYPDMERHPKQAYKTPTFESA